MRAVIVPQELVVIAGNVDDLGALARLAQHLLHEVVVRLRPVPVGLQRPAIDDVADQIDGVGIMGAEKIQQPVGLRAAGSEMDVGDKQSAKAPFRQLVTHNVIPMREQLIDSRDSLMTRHALGASRPSLSRRGDAQFRTGMVNASDPAARFHHDGAAVETGIVHSPPRKADGPNRSFACADRRNSSALRQPSETSALQVVAANAGTHTPCRPL